MKKLCVILLILVLITSVVIGCGTPAPTTPTPKTPAATTPGLTTPTPTVSSTPTKPSATTTPIVPTKPATAVVPTTPRYGGVLRWAKPTGPGASFASPWLSDGTSAFELQFAMQTLLKEQSDGSMVPNLASSYDVVANPANPSITFHLVKGVKFSDGTNFNAQAVKWNLDMAKSPGSKTSGSARNWKSIEVLDDYTLRVNLTAWQNTLVRAFSEGSGYMVSPTAFEKNGADWMMWNAVGAGAFIQRNFERDVSLSFTRNENYWEAGKPYLFGIQLLFVTDSMTALALFKSGGADVLQTSTAQMSSELKSAGFKILAKQGAMGSTLVPDSLNADSPWSKLKVRMAVEYAIDKEAIAKAFGYGFWEASYQHNTSGSPAYDPNLSPRKYDVAKAKQLLSEAGYPEGFKTTIIVGPLNIDRNAATAIQSFLGAVGIKADLDFPQSAAFSAYLTGTWRNAVLYGPVLGYGDPNAGWSLALAKGSAWYQSLKKPDGWAELYEASLSAPKLDPALAKKCEAALYNDVTYIPIHWGSKEWAVTDKVQGSGVGTRGTYTWWEPQNTWLSP